MTKHYLDIDYKNTCFYEYSKEAKEGFEEHTTNSGKVSYRKLYTTGVFGVLQSISMVETQRQGTKLVLRLVHGDDIYLAGLSMYDQRSNFDNRFIEPLISMLPNLAKNQAYRIFPWAMESETLKKRDGSPRVNYGLSIKKADLDTLKVLEGDDAKIFPKYARRKKDEAFDENKHLPDLDFVTELGKFIPTAVSVDARRKFLVNLLEAGLTELGYNPTNQGSTQPAQTSNATPAAKPVNDVKVHQAEVVTAKDLPNTVEEEDYDDLPF